MGKSGSDSDPKDALLHPSRRDFMKLAGLGGVVLVSGLGVRSYAADDYTIAQVGAAGKKAVEKAQEFYFVQLSDTHWGSKGRR